MLLPEIESGANLFVGGILIGQYDFTDNLGLGRLAASLRGGTTAANYFCAVVNRKLHDDAPGVPIRCEVLMQEQVTGPLGLPADTVFVAVAPFYGLAGIPRPDEAERYDDMWRRTHFWVLDPEHGIVYAGRVRYDRDQQVLVRDTSRVITAAEPDEPGSQQE